MPTLSLPARISRPSARLVRGSAVAVLLTQCLIAVTGATVRVTGSGLGCPTWPQCFPGSMVPVSHADIAPLHQAVEFGNRLLTWVVAATALVCLLLAWRVRPARPRLRLLAGAVLIGVPVQAVIGGMTVLLDLLWWSVSLHFTASAVLIWLAGQLVKATREGDQFPRPVVTTGMRRVLVAACVAAAGMVLAGTLVTAAGPHAGDPATPRLPVAITLLTQVHGLFVMAYLCLLAVFGVWLRNAAPTRGLLRAYTAACLVVLAQGVLGSVQYAIGVPEALVVLHVAGATLVITTLSLLWGESRYRGPVPPTESRQSATTSERAPA
ncbi:COX15/CtaA family protein [Actinopolyspora mortivallis]|uniref:COX15/CtaA family protein n=1 Tax=Actinopolyspora mortivallis TaxID=33906 RepID=UPI000479847C|nr:heme A synthase [Actinopolyspora mortivallis]